MEHFKSTSQLHNVHNIISLLQPNLSPTPRKWRMYYAAGHNFFWPHMADDSHRTVKDVCVSAQDVSEMKSKQKLQLLPSSGPLELWPSRNWNHYRKQPQVLNTKLLWWSDTRNSHLQFPLQRGQRGILHLYSSTNGYFLMVSQAMYGPTTASSLSGNSSRRYEPFYRLKS